MLQDAGDYWCTHVHKGDNITILVILVNFFELHTLILMILFPQGLQSLYFWSQAVR